jgi:methionyl aminopeptidase
MFSRIKNTQMNKITGLTKLMHGRTDGVTIKSVRELDRMREAGHVVALTLDLLQRSVEPGMRTRDLDTLAEREIRRLGAKPGFKGYLGFPASICASVNDEIVHGIPGNRVLQEGDIISIDAGAIVDGFNGDAAVTIPVGQVSTHLQRLIDVTRDALNVGIRSARSGARIGDIGAAIQTYVESQSNYGIVREYVGHGIGRNLHEDPSIPNFGQAGHGLPLRENMCIAIEPMLNIGDCQTRLLEDGWTVVTADGNHSAHFEHTIAVTEAGPEVLTTLEKR